MARPCRASYRHDGIRQDDFFGSAGWRSSDPDAVAEGDRSPGVKVIACDGPGSHQRWLRPTWLESQESALPTRHLFRAVASCAPVRLISVIGVECRLSTKIRSEVRTIGEGKVNPQRRASAATWQLSRRVMFEDATGWTDAKWTVNQSLLPNGALTVHFIQNARSWEGPNRRNRLEAKQAKSFESN